MLGYVLSNPNYTANVSQTNLLSQFTNTSNFMSGITNDMNWYF
jgi:hypothetical protein